MNLTTRLTILLGAVFAISLGLILGLNIIKFNSTLKDLTQARAGVLLDGVAKGIQLAYDLGVSLESPINEKNIQTWYSQAKLYDPEIENVILFGRDGTIIYSAGPILNNKSIVGDWQKKHDLNSERVWAIRATHTLTMGIPVTSKIGTVSGGVIIVRTWGDLKDSVPLAFRDLSVFALLSLVIMISLSIPICLVLSRNLRSILSEMLHNLSNHSNTNANYSQKAAVLLTSEFLEKINEAEFELLILDKKLKRPKDGGL